jgi:cytosine permease
LSLERSGVLHLFFLLVPVWLFATVCYAVFAALMGARSAYPEADRYEAAERARKAAEREYLDRESTAAHTARRRPGDRITAAARGVAVLSLVLCLGMAIRVLLGGSLDTFRNWLILPTLMYFVAATVWIVRKERDAYNDGRGADPAGTSTFTQGSQTS